MYKLYIIKISKIKKQGAGCVTVSSVYSVCEVTQTGFYRRINSDLIHIDRKAARKETSKLKRELSKATNTALSKTRGAETMQKV